MDRIFIWKNIELMLIMVGVLGNYAKKLLCISPLIYLIITVSQNNWNNEFCKQKSADQPFTIWFRFFDFDCFLMILFLPICERRPTMSSRWRETDLLINRLVHSLDSHLIGHCRTQQSLENIWAPPPPLLLPCSLKGAVTCDTILMVTASNSRGILFGLPPEIEQEAMSGRLASHRGH